MKLTGFKETLQVVKYCVGITAVMLVASTCRAAEKEIGPVAKYTPVAEQLRAIIPYELEDKNIPAISIVLIDDQQIVWAAGFGTARQADRRPADAATVYRVGSISKLLTDLAVMQLVERGELDLDAPVQKYLPDFKPQNPFDVPITLRQLMSHRAGLVRESPVGNYFDDSQPTLAETVASLNSTKLVYKPATRTKYSNAGIAVVGYVLEHTQKTPFPQYVREHVLAPSNMSTAGFEPLVEARDHMADGWMWSYDGRQFLAPTFLLGTNAAGNLFASVTDMGQLLMALFRVSDDQSQPVRKSTLEEMFKPQFSDDPNNGFGLGYYISQFEGKRRIGHGGAVYGHATRFAALPDEKLGVVVIANKDVANGLVDYIGDHVLRCMLAVRNNQPIPEYGRTARIPPERAQRFAGWYATSSEPPKIAEITTWNRQPRLRYEDRRVDLRMLGDAILPDDVQGRGPELHFDGNDKLTIGDQVYQRVPQRRPAKIPDHWQGLIGEYGWDHNTLYIVESHGQLYALIEWFFFYPLTEVDENTYKFPEEGGLYHGESLIFSRDNQGRATKVVAASVEFPRRKTADDETFRIQALASIEALRNQAMQANPPQEVGEFRTPDLVEITTLDDTIHLDIRYASTNNFVGEKFYTQARAFAQRDAAEALVRVQERLKKDGYGLLIHDAYRPWYVTKMFYDATPETMKIFVADPAKGSRHNRGAAIDLSLYDLSTGAPVRMPSGYDEFSPRAFPEYPGGTTLERWQRDLLRRRMESEGFTVYEFEWWHFDYQDWQKYPILNAPFEKLGK